MDEFWGEYVEKSGLSRRNVIVGAAWSVPVVAVAVATPSASATEPALLTGVFSPWTFANRQFTGLYTVTSQGVETDELDVAFYLGNAEVVSITPPAGWVEVDSGEELYRVWVFSGTPVTGFPYVFEYVVDEGYFTLPQGLDASLYSSLVPIDDSIDFDPPVTGFFTPIVSPDGTYYTTYIVRTFGDDQAAGAITVELDIPAGAILVATQDNGLSLTGSTLTNTRTVEYVLGAWITFEIDPAKVSSADVIGSQLSLGADVIGTNARAFAEAFEVGQLPTVTYDGINGTYGLYYGLAADAGLPLGWFLLTVTVQNIEDLYINLDVAGYTWTVLGFAENGAAYDMSLLYFGDFSASGSIYFGYPPTVPLEETRAHFVATYSGAVVDVRDEYLAS